MQDQISNIYSGFLCQHHVKHKTIFSISFNCINCNVFILVSCWMKMFKTASASNHNAKQLPICQHAYPFVFLISICQIHLKTDFKVLIILQIIQMLLMYNRKQIGNSIAAIQLPVSAAKYAPQNISMQQILIILMECAIAC